MKKRCIQIMIIIIVILLTFVSFPGCGSQQSEGKDHLKIYVVNNGDNSFYKLINNYNSTTNKKIDLVEFENNDLLNSKLSAELMANSGPDLILLNQDLPIEKLINQGCFCNINELIEEDNDKSVWKNCKNTILDAGIIDDKRYIIPVSYTPELMITTQEICEKNMISSDSTLEYRSISQDLSYFVSLAQKTKNMGVWFHAFPAFFDLIDNYVNFNDKTYDFSSKEFLSNFDEFNNVLLPFDKKIKRDKTTQPVDRLLQGEILFIYPEVLGDVSPISIGYIYHEITAQGQTPLLLKQISTNSSQMTAVVDKALMINKNSKNKTQAYQFIKYMLSDKTQSKREIGVPVNMNAMNYAINQMKNEKYDLSALLGINYKAVGVDETFLNQYLELLNNIEFCKIQHDYYNNNIVRASFNKFLTGELSKNQFLNELESKTKIYMEE